MKILLENKGQTVNTKDFARRIWPDEIFVDCKNAISVHVHHIRRKLNDAQKPYIFIKTSWGAGYILE